MKAPRNSSLWLAMAAALTLTNAAIAATPPADEHSAHHPPVAQADTEGAQPADTATTPAARLQALQERMKAMRESTDPQARMDMMGEQMADLEAMMADVANCPMMSGGAPGRMGMGMMGGMGMGGMGMGMGGTGSAGTPTTQPEIEALRRQHVELMQKRMEMMEKRLDMMQMMMQMQMQQQRAMPGAPATQ